MSVVDQNAIFTPIMYNVQTHVRVYGGKLKREHGETVARVYEKADTSFNDEMQRDNLIETSRTSWNVEQEYPDEMRPVLDDICDVLRHGFSFVMQEQINMHADLGASWIARSKEGAVVDPHHHGHNPSGWSFCFYAKIPSGQSSLTFVDQHIGVKSCVVVSEGDVIWFPSSLSHYTVDTEEGRLIYSGNFSMAVSSVCEMPPELTQEQLDEQKVY